MPQNWTFKIKDDGSVQITHLIDTSIVHLSCCLNLDGTLEVILLPKSNTSAIFLKIFIYDFINNFIGI